MGGNAIIFARELGDAPLLVKLIYSKTYNMNRKKILTRSWASLGYIVIDILGSEPCSQFKTMMTMDVVVVAMIILKMTKIMIFA